jgi:large subunit ribosomal protein L5
MSKYEPRLYSYYKSDIRTILNDRFNYKNELQIPSLSKVVLNIGVGQAVSDSKKIQSALSSLTTLSGQKPVTTFSKKSIAGFKLREGQPIGVMVTLRKARMYEFLDRLINIALPRVRDFRGYSSKSFDGMGNFSFGIREHVIFPEIHYDDIDTTWGMNVVVCTSAKTDEEARELISSFNFPFKK